MGGESTNTVAKLVGSNDIRLEVCVCHIAIPPPPLPISILFPVLLLDDILRSSDGSIACSQHTSFLT